MHSGYGDCRRVGRWLDRLRDSARLVFSFERALSNPIQPKGLQAPPLAGTGTATGTGTCCLSWNRMVHVPVPVLILVYSPWHALFGAPLRAMTSGPQHLYSTLMFRVPSNVQVSSYCTIIGTVQHIIRYRIPYQDTSLVYLYLNEVILYDNGYTRQMAWSHRDQDGPALRLNGHHFPVSEEVGSSSREHQ